MGVICWMCWGGAYGLNRDVAVAFAFATQFLGRRECPSQEAERRCCYGGGEAGRRASRDRAKDGPSRRAPITAPERRHRASLGELGRMVGRRPFGYFWGVCQKYLAVRAKPLVELDTYNGYVLVPFNNTAYISIWCIKTFYGFRPYGGSLLPNSRKSKQKGLAPAYGFRFAQVPSLRSRSVGTP